MGIRSAGALANVKHCIANCQEAGRHSINEVIDERALREIYMPGFKAGLRQGDVAPFTCASGGQR
jgi:beta-glucosidase